MNYKIVQAKSLLGSGAYGKVFSVRCLEERSGKETDLALKCHMKDRYVDFTFCIRELDILRKFRHHPFILSLSGVLSKDEIGIAIDYSQTLPKSEDRMTYQGVDQFHILTEMANDNLYGFILEFRRRRFLPDDYLTMMVGIFNQFLMAIEFLHSNNVIHRDIKTDNVLLFKSGNITRACLSDYGFSQFLTKQEVGAFSVMAYLYRSPEIVMKMKYGLVADVWALGCVFYEMIFTREFLEAAKLTNPGTVNDHDDREAVATMFAMLSEPPNHRAIDLVRRQLNKDYSVYMATPRLTYEQRMDRLFQQRHYEHAARYGITRDNICFLLRKMLAFLPDERYTTSQLLDCDIFKQFRSRHLDLLQIHPLDDLSAKVSRVMIVNCFERCQVIKILLGLYNSLNIDTINKWFSVRVLFHTLNHFDTYLYNYYVNNGKKLNKDLQLFPDQKQVMVAFYTIMYLIVKYFYGSNIWMSFKTYMDILEPSMYTPAFENEAREFEIRYLKELKFDIYKATMYEIADKMLNRPDVTLAPDEVTALIKTYTAMKPFATLVTTHRQMFEYFRDVILPINPSKRSEHINGRDFLVTRFKAESYSYEFNIQ